jgi:uncharacterized protein YecE (DUF72 family)
VSATREIRIGISGWRYAGWRGVFYPKGLPQRDELRYAAQRLNTVEINGSFYSLQRPESFRAWYDQTPQGFVFAVKGARFITHMKKLADIETPLANFFASGLLTLREKLGPVLWQLPPTLPFDAARMAAFFAKLPRSTVEAAYLARRHDERMTGRAWTGTEGDRPLRHAVEVRHPSYDTPGFLDILRAHSVAVVLADSPGRWPVIREATADFRYARLHGSEELYTSGYDDESLEQWAAAIRSWAPADTYVYFDNDVKAYAPRDAMALSAKLRSAPDPSTTSHRNEDHRLEPAIDVGPSNSYFEGPA